MQLVMNAEANLKFLQGVLLQSLFTLTIIYFDALISFTGGCFFYALCLFVFVYIQENRNLSLVRNQTGYFCIGVAYVLSLPDK